MLETSPQKVCYTMIERQGSSHTQAYAWEPKAPAKIGSARHCNRVRLPQMLIDQVQEGL